MEKDIEKQFTETAALLSKFYLEQKNKVKTRKQQAAKEMFQEISQFIIQTNKRNTEFKIKDLKAYLIKSIDVNEHKLKKIIN